MFVCVQCICRQTSGNIEYNRILGPHSVVDDVTEYTLHRNRETPNNTASNFGLFTEFTKGSLELSVSLNLFDRSLGVFEDILVQCP